MGRSARDKPLALLVLDQMARNAAMALPGVARARTRLPRTAVEAGPAGAGDLELYAWSPFERTLRAAGGELRDLTILEVGPGDHIPAALLFLAAGARRYIAVDRFLGDVGGASARRFYRQLGASMEDRAPALAAALKSRGVDPAEFPRSAGPGVELLKCSIEEALRHRRDPVDVVTSTNVVEHVYDLGAFARSTWQLLKPGGIAVHRVDYSAHDVWRDRAEPLEWLTFSDRIWAAMGSRRGSPNRCRHHEVVEALESAGFVVEEQVLERYPAELVERWRPRLAPRFRDMPIDSLSVKTASLVARR